MKKLFMGLVLAALVPLQACAQEMWKEGTHYRVINDTATSQPVVTEYFSFWCPACYQAEPLVQMIKEKLDKDAKFSKVHVNFMGFTGPDVQDDVTRGMMIARALKREDELNGAIFNAIHRQRTPITGLSDVRSIFIANGVDGDEFDKLASSFGVNSLFQKNNKEIAKHRNYLTGVPNFIVNGKYQAIFTRNMTTDDIISLIVWLSEQK